jgi:ribosomal protein S18 acetylase RimI-like enzyme
MSATAIVDLDASNLETLPCCGVSNSNHPGRRAKNCWLAAQLKLGLRCKLLQAPDGRYCGSIEYVPGEFAWRAVDAAGHLFIHCIWIHRREYQRRGLAGRLLDACIEEARNTGTRGVAVVARDGPFMAGPALFLAHGFQVVACAPPDYHLLVRKFSDDTPDPKFRENPVPQRYRRGLTIIRSAQCPYAVKFTDEIADAAEHEFGLTPRIVELKSHRDAQNAPTPFAIFSVIHNGRIVADHPISRTRFRNIMRAAYTT